MKRLPLGQLEEALANPAAYRAKLDAGPVGGFGETYFGALRQTIFQYHSGLSAADASCYLERRLTNSRTLRSATRRATTLDQFDWYISEYVRQGWPTFQTKLNISVPVPLPAEEQIKCTGEISRIDLVPAGGYAGWLFASALDHGWQAELRMPLIQGVLADHLSVPLSEMRVGVVDFGERSVVSHTYPDHHVEAAFRRFTRLIGRLGY